MSEHYHHFIRGDTHVVLPVTPESYTWGAAKAINQVSLTELGEINLPGPRKRYSGSFECLFPAANYPWLAPGSRADPAYYVELFTAWAVETGTPVRFLVEGTPVNALVLIEGFEYTEKDGSGDVYAKVTLREWTEVEAASVVTASDAAGAANGSQNTSGAAQQYTVAAGDTLSAICRRFYGNGTAAYYNALAVYNGIKNPNVIYVGAVLTIPSLAEITKLLGQTPQGGGGAGSETGGKRTNSAGAGRRSAAMIALYD